MLHTEVKNHNAYFCSRYYMMEYFYLIIIVILFALAITNLMVGVTYNIVNSVNSAIGPNFSLKWIFLFVTGAGILTGATFSTGMLEVTKTGVFHPDMFVFPEIMVIFLSVMISDVILLNIFNATGIPTSSTITIVFELLGSALAISLVKIKNQGGAFTDLTHYINTENALLIIAGILLSVFIAFISGAIIQFLTRLVFTFNFKKKPGYIVSFFGGVFLTVICYFILIRGIDNSVFARLQVGIQNVPLNIWIKQNTWLLLLFSMTLWTIILRLLKWAFKTEIFKVVVWAGTFTLAMAFAGNDLAFFSGIPLAGYQSYQAWEISSEISAVNLKMNMLTGAVDTPFVLVFTAGIIIFLILAFSKKPRSFYSSGVLPGDYVYGEERFGSSFLARILTRKATNLSIYLSAKIPESVNNAIQKRFLPVESIAAYNVPQSSFDHVRSSVNLFVSCVIIAYGTSMKMPLSTIAITFMAAMGSSLADRIWTRKNSVYKISAIFTITGGWLLAAIIAIVVSSFIAWVINAGGLPVIIGLILIAAILVIRTQVLYWRQSKKPVADDDLISEKDETGRRIEKRCRQVVKTIISANKILSFSLDGFFREDHDLLQEALKMNDELNRKTKKQKNKIIRAISEVNGIDPDSGHFYIQVSDYQREIAHSLNCLIELLTEYFGNQQRSFIDPQTNEIRLLVTGTDEFFNLALHIVKEDKFEEISELVAKKTRITEVLHDIETEQINRIKNREVNTGNLFLFFKALSETKNLLHHSVNLIKSHHDFIIANKKTA